MIVTIKVVVIVLFIMFGMSYINTANWHPFVPPNEGHFGTFGWSGVLAASGVIFFAYIGFDAISTAAQEAKNPQRDMPVGILASLVDLHDSLRGRRHWCSPGWSATRSSTLPPPSRLRWTSIEGLHWLGFRVKLGAVAGMTSVMLVMTIAQARIFFAMARDGLMPKFFGRVHPKFRTPSVGTVVTGVFAAVIGGLFPVGLLGHLVSIGTLAAFVTVCIGVLVLRHTRPDLPRPFRTPLAVVHLPGRRRRVRRDDAVAGRATLGSAWYSGRSLGVAVYVLYGYRHSRLHRAGT